MPKQLTISAINCNSLNMASSTSILQMRKIYGITKLRTDIIFLSDIRIRNKNLVSSSDDLEKVFCINPYRSYNFIFNSSKNKRGVGMLIGTNVDFTEIDRKFDLEENFLLIKAIIKGVTVILGSLYMARTVLMLNFTTI